MEEKKSNTKKGIIIFVVCLAIFGLFIFVEHQIDKHLEEKNKTAEKEEKKEEPKEEEKKEETNPEDKLKGHNGCSICDEDGNFCCQVGEDIKTYDYINLENMRADVTSKVQVIQNGDYKYQVKYTFEDGEAKVEVNGRSMYDDHYALDYIFVLDNGVLGVEYYDEINQARLKTRIYYTTDLQSIRKVEGIKENVSLFAKEYEVTERGNVCIDNKYVELRTNKVTIGNNSVRVDNIKTDKEENCANLT